jgi:hypothetical protein
MPYKSRRRLKKYLGARDLPGFINKRTKLDIYIQIRGSSYHASRKLNTPLLENGENAEYLLLWLK